MTDSKERKQSSSLALDIDTHVKCCHTHNNNTTHFLVSFPWLLLLIELDFDSLGVVLETTPGSGDL